MRLVSLVAVLASCEPDAGAAPTPASEPAPASASTEKPATEAGSEEIPAEADAEEAVPEGRRAPVPVELRRSSKELPIRTRPAHNAPLRGLTGEGASFRVLARVDGPDCPAGWAQLEARGFLCLEGTEPTDVLPVPWPPLVTFDPPDPAEFEHYLETGEYDHGQPEALVPAVYAKRWGRFKGRLYASLEDYLAGKPSVGQLDPGVGMKYRFERIVETEKGPVLTRDDGKVARLDDVYLYPITRHQGRDLEADPVPEGQWPAFAIAYEGTSIMSEPREDAAVLKTVPYHTPLLIEDKPADSSGRWWKVVGGGYVNDWRGIRHPVPSPGRPSGVGDNELWVDIELEQQVLMVRRGDALVYFTVVATGAAPMGTPKGTYQVRGMYAFKDMRSREGADDVYFVEDVPWTIVFKPHYALHGAYWHWGFGRTASHGCVNLAPKDAAWLFSHLEPGLPDGWRVILSEWTLDTERTSEDSAPGEALEAATVVRIRRGNDVGPDRRGER